MRPTISRGRGVLGVAVAAACATMVTACATGMPDQQVITSVTVQDARSLLGEAGAKVDKVEYGLDSFTVTSSLGPERYVWFDGMNCKGAAQDKTCDEFKISTAWQVDTPARAEALARKLNYNYSSVYADGATLRLWRMDFIPGGITRKHLRNTVRELFELRRQAEDEIWPPMRKSTPPSPGGSPQQ